MNLGEKNILESAQITKSKLDELVLELNSRTSKLNQNDNPDYVLISMRNLTIYTSTLIERLAFYKQAPIEFCAISSRNLFECYLLVSFILANPSKAKEFAGQKAGDELEIGEGFLSIAKPEMQEIAIKWILERITAIKNLMNKHEIPIGGHWTVSYLAKQTNNEVEYKAFFKLYSKYIHPSSWLVNSLSSEYDSPVFRNIFLLQGQQYANRVLTLVSKYLNK